MQETYLWGPDLTRPMPPINKDPIGTHFTACRLLTLKCTPKKRCVHNILRINLHCWSRLPPDSAIGLDYKAGIPVSMDMSHQFRAVRIESPTLERHHSGSMIMLAFVSALRRKRMQDSPLDLNVDTPSTPLKRTPRKNN